MNLPRISKKVQSINTLTCQCERRFHALGDGSTPGSTDEFRIYTGALTAQQIAADYANGPNVIPEPASLSLLFLSGGLMLRRRRGKV